MAPCCCHRLVGDLDCGLGQAGKGASGVEPARAAGEDRVPVDVSRTQAAHYRVRPVADAWRVPDAEATLGEDCAGARTTLGGVAGGPVHQRRVDPGSENQILHYPTDRIVSQDCDDGCVEVRRVGGANDNGADVVGRLPDGRSMVIQCKRYAPTSTIASRELRDLLGARVHFGADLAVFVTTTRISRPSEKFALQHGNLAVHRDHLGVWNGGASLMSLAEINGAGQGDARHRTRWKQAYSE